MITLLAIVFAMAGAPGQEDLKAQDPLPKCSLTTVADWGYLDFYVQSKPFDPDPERLTMKDGELYLDGNKVWMYSVEETGPRTEVESITVYVDGRKVVLPEELLVGLYEVNCVLETRKYGQSEQSRWRLQGSAWLEPDRVSWHAFIGCADGGASFGVYFKGKIGERKVERIDYRDSFVVGKFSALLPPVNSGSV